MRSTRHAPLSRFTLLIALALAFAAQAMEVRTAHVTAELVGDETALVPGTTSTLALRLAIDRGWHTYWRNPGESGLPTTLAWHLPTGFAAGDIVWPAPRALPAGPLVNYGYEGEVLHLVPVAVPASAAVGTTVSLAARADWLVCKETCIPEGADLRLDLPVAAETGPSRWHAAIAATRAALPKSLPAGWSASASAEGPVIELRLTPPADAADPGSMQFFADADRRIEASVAQRRVRDGGGGYALALPVSHEFSGGFGRLRGVLRAERGFTSAGGITQAVALDVPMTGTPVAGPRPAAVSPGGLGSPADASALSLPIALLFALLGGLLLNLMPCVFPVLSLKAIGLAAADAGDRRALRLEGIAFAAGVVLAFAAFGASLAGLRAAGQQLGWGFQLQSPAVVTTLAILFFVMAQNLSGVFEFATLVPSRVATWSHANRQVNAFASGLLAVAIASPCTAPFMGAAMGYALAERSSVTLVVFVSLGIGMALPYFLLAWFPQWRRALPRPGAWMERLKQLLAFPLYATVAWLVWVLGAQVGNDAVMRIGVTLVAISFALWALRAARAGGRRIWSGIALAGALAAAVVAWPLLVGNAMDTGAVQARVSRTDGWQTYSPENLAQWSAEGRPVFVDFTAAWCITCQVNERFVLNDARVRDAFARRGVVRVRADWTRRDPVITEALSALGRSGVPVYVLYRKDREPQIFSELLQRQALLDAIAAS